MLRVHVSRRPLATTGLPARELPPHELRKSQSRRLAISCEVSFSRAFIHALNDLTGRRCYPRFEPRNTGTNLHCWKYRERPQRLWPQRHTPTESSLIWEGRIRTAGRL